MSRRASGGWQASDGFTWVDVTITLAFVATMTALALPSAAHVVDVSRGRHAARYLAAELRAARQHAVLSRRSTAIVFDRAGTDWTFRRCHDGNGDGVRRADLNTGIDPCRGPGLRLGSLIGEVSIALPSSVLGPDDEVPGGDAVRFGSSGMASCSPTGGCSVGTVFVRSQRAQFAVRVGGITGRVRVLSYEPGSLRWLPE